MISWKCRSRRSRGRKRKWRKGVWSRRHPHPPPPLHRK
jgi:hypothetical protein